MRGADERDYYARRAASARNRAGVAVDPEIRAIYEKMAQSYEKLVEEADRIAHLQARLEKAVPPTLDDFAIAEQEGTVPALFKALTERKDATGSDKTILV